MMLKKTIYPMLPVMVLGLMLTTAWATMPNDLNLERQFEMGSQSWVVADCSRGADMMTDLFILAKGGGGCGGGGGGSAGSSGAGVAGGHGGHGGHQGHGPMGQSAHEHQNQFQNQHQYKNNYGVHSQTQSHYGPGDGTGNDGEGPQDGTGYGADSAR
jgi:hypothetical protein